MRPLLLLMYCHPPWIAEANGFDKSNLTSTGYKAIRKAAQFAFLLTFHYLVFIFCLHLMIHMKKFFGSWALNLQQSNFF